MKTNLSGGERQRISFIREIVLNPEILILMKPQVLLIVKM